MAITDRRELAFDPIEMRACLTQADLPSNPGNRLGKPPDIELDPATNRVRLHYGSLLDPARATVDLEGAALAVVLMKWCSAKGIPLPRSGSKILKVEADRIVLTIVTKFGS